MPSLTNFSLETDGVCCADVLFPVGAHAALVKKCVELKNILSFVKYTQKLSETVHIHVYSSAV